MGRIITSLVVRKQTDGDVLKTAEKAFCAGLQISIHVFPFITHRKTPRCRRKYLFIRLRRGDHVFPDFSISDAEIFVARLFLFILDFHVGDLDEGIQSFI